MLKAAFISSVVVITLAAPASALAICEKYEASELRAMKTSKLNNLYCSNEFEIRMEKIQQKKANDMMTLELRNPAGTKMRELDAQQRRLEKSMEVVSACRHENSRIIDALHRAKYNLSKLEKSCSA